jgi:hypothetical protein
MVRRERFQPAMQRFNHSTLDQQRQCPADRIAADRAVSRNRDLAGGITGACALRAASPIGHDRISHVAKIRTRDRFEKASTEEDLLLREPDHDVVARVTCAGKEQFARCRESRRVPHKVRGRCRDRCTVAARELDGQGMSQRRDTRRLKGWNSTGTITMKVRGWSCPASVDRLSS